MNIKAGEKYKGQDRGEIYTIVRVRKNVIELKDKKNKKWKFPDDWEHPLIDLSVDSFKHIFTKINENNMTIKKLIREEIKRFLIEADDAAKNKARQELEKKKQDLAQQKQDLAQSKLDFQKQKATTDDRKDDQEREKEQDQEAGGGEQGGEAAGGGEQAPEPNISFKTQGVFYKDTLANIKNLQLSNGDLLDDDEKHYVALAAQAAEGRFDKGFIKFLKSGKAGNVYGKDFSDEDIKKIVEYLRKNELVR